MTFQEILKQFKTLPTAGKILSIIAITILLVVSLFFSSCGTTQAIVRNGASGTTTEIKITTSNPTSVTATPNVNITPNLK